MNTGESKITFQNLVNTIDRTVLNLSKIKKGEDFSKELKNQISNIITFVIDSKNETFPNVLYNKGVFIERESLEILHNNLNDFNFSKEELDEIIKNIELLDNTNIREINKIQSVLIKISIPIWETTQQLNNE